MDTKQLIKDARARFTQNSSKSYLKEKYEAKLIFASQGGLWKATPELISFLASLEQDEVILLDSYENPIKVDRLELVRSLLGTYNSVMFQWYNEVKELENVR
jgi:hypothetical protein